MAAAAWVGVFCAITGVAVLWAIVRGGSMSENGVVLLAIGLRVATVVMALAAVQAWGRLIPAWLLLAGLWGAAATQLAYPVAETVVKGLILGGLMDPIDKGISNMSAEGWFNFGGTWLIWGVPGVLFTLAALDHGRKVSTRGRSVALGIGGGIVLLVGLGMVIG
ncbi:hypothetical protein [Blastococcus litoris]|uniref:hypothetical protein n=1 Tax=Blastococcus litoris TaxID=2171622 RepID=UPI000E303C64|nr:hypothetical protein [Blastococcus litoris]